MKKNLIKVTIILSMLLSTLIPLSVGAMSGNGTEESPFMITNQDELELVTDFPDCHFKLANDIVMTKELKFPLCYESENQTFTGVFDGNGYTISDVAVYGYDFSCTALFYCNDGIIDNLNIVVKKSAYSTSEQAGVTAKNNGTISNCSVSGDVSVLAAGIAFYNYGIIEKCKVDLSLFTPDELYGITYLNSGTILQCKVFGNSYGNCNKYAICQSNDGTIEDCCFVGELSGDVVTGICNRNSGAIENCYFIGKLSGDIMAGICTYNGSWREAAKIKNCYVVATFADAEDIYPIAYNYEDTNSTIENCYYDKTVSGINSTIYGTPKSTTAMKIKQTYKNWDFDNVWGIDENINDGYPYLLWEYPNVEAKNPYTVNDVKIKDLSGNELEEIPDRSFYFEINVTKNDNSKNADSLIIAVYDENGAFIDLKYMSGTYYQDQTVSFGSMINITDNKIGKIKAFVWDSISGMHPLSNSMEITN